MAMVSSVSVVLTTYNGSDYIIPQLESLRIQTLKPDEVLIFDDKSTDDTVSKVINFIEDNNLNWLVSINPKRYGWKYNFIQGFHKARYDLIFPCDQDDIWERHKIEYMSKILTERPEIDLLVSNYSLLIDSTYEGKIKSVPFNNDNNIVQLSILEARNISRPGCVYCFRNNFFKKISSFWEEDFPHDAWIWIFAILRQSAFLYQYPSISFRRHRNNNSPKFIRTKESRLQKYDLSEKMFKKFADYCISESNLDFSAHFAHQFEQFYHARKQYLQFSQLRSIIIMMRFIRFYGSFKEFLGDILIRFSIFEKRC